MAEQSAGKIELGASTKTVKEKRPPNVKYGTLIPQPSREDTVYYNDEKIETKWVTPNLKIF